MNRRNFLRTVLVIGLALVLPLRALATTWYFSNAGSDAANGTAPATPKQHPNLVTFASNDTILIQGSVYSSVAGTSVFALSSLSNITIDQWASNGCQPARVRADVPITAAWTADAVSTNVYSAAVTAGLNLQTNATGTSVMVGAGRRVDQFGRHSPFLKLRAFSVSTAVTLAAMVEGEFYYDTVGVMYVHLGGHAPTTTEGPYQVSYTLFRVDVATFSTCNNLRIQNVSFEWGNDGDAQGQQSGNGYCVLVTNSTGCRLRNLRTIGFGYHGIGFTTSGSTAESDNQIEYCDCHGSGPGGKCLVFYASAANVTGCRGLGIRAYPYGRIYIDGTVVSTSQDMTGFYAHTGHNDDLSTHTAPDSTQTVSDLEWQRCVCYGYPDMGALIQAFDGANAPAITNTDDWTKYGNRCIECRVFGGAQNRITDSIAFVRCLMDFSNSSASKATYGNTGQGGFRMNRGANFGSYYTLLDSCVVSCRMDQDPGATGETFFTFSSTPSSSGDADKYGKTSYEARLKLKNTTYFEDGVPIASSVRALFKELAARCSIDCYQSLIGFTSLESGASGQVYRLITGDGSTPDANLNFRGTAYFGLYSGGSTTTRWSAASNRWFQSTWKAVIDSQQVIPGAFPLNGTGVCFLDPDLTSTFKLTTGTILGHADLGFNQRSYSKQYGASQYGTLNVLADPTRLAPGNRPVPLRNRDQ